MVYSIHLIKTEGVIDCVEESVMVVMVVLSNMGFFI